MRYLALVALLAFLAVPFLAGCAEKAPTPPKEKPPVKEKVTPETPPAPAPPAPAPPAPAPAPPATK
jgi:hypothetical protein